MGRPIQLALALVTLAVGQDYPFVLRTVAGSFPLGDDGPATQALLQTVSAVVVDSQGQLHILDSAQRRIRFVNSSGKISTVAVLGNFSYDICLAPDEQSYIVLGPDQLTRVTLAGATSLIAGRALPGDDDGPVAVPINTDPQSHVVLDPAGNIYISETASHRVRRFDVDGKVRLIAGTGKDGFSGDGGPATQAQLNMPTGLAYDALTGSLYIADSWNHRIRRVARDGTISTIAGTGQYYFPNDGVALQTPIGVVSALALDRNGNLFVGDGSYGMLLKVTPAGALTKVGGLLFQQTPLADGKALETVFQGVLSLAADARGGVYVTDRSARVRRVA